PFQNRFFELDFRTTNLFKRYPPTITAHQREISKPCRIKALSPSTSEHDRHIANILAYISHRNAGEKKLKLLADLRRRKPDKVQAVEIRNEAQNRRAVAPIPIGIPHIIQ